MPIYRTILSLLSLAVILSLTTAGHARPGVEVPLPIDLDLASDDWDFEANRVRVVNDQATGAPAFEPVQLPRQPLQAKFTSVRQVPLPAVAEAQVRLPAVFGDFPPNKFSRAAAVLSYTQPRSDSESNKSMAALAMHK